jgi:hypothetical protein
MIASLRPTRRLKKVDLPTFGLPTIAITFPTLYYFVTKIVKIAQKYEFVGIRKLLYKIMWSVGCSPAFVFCSCTARKTCPSMTNTENNSLEKEYFVPVYK